MQLFFPLALLIFELPSNPDLFSFALRAAFSLTPFRARAQVSLSLSLPSNVSTLQAFVLFLRLGLLAQCAFSRLFQLRLLVVAILPFQPLRQEAACG